MELMFMQRTRTNGLHCISHHAMVPSRLPRHYFSEGRMLMSEMVKTGHQLNWHSGVDTGRLCDYCRRVRRACRALYINQHCLHICSDDPYKSLLIIPCEHSPITIKRPGPTVVIESFIFIRDPFATR